MTVIDRFIFKTKQIMLYIVLRSYPKQVWDYLKQAIVFAVSVWTSWMRILGYLCWATND